MTWQPTWQLLVAFNNAAQDDPGLIATVASPAGTLGGFNVWTDVSPWVQGQVDTNRGRQHEAGRFQTGTISVTLLNDDARFDSWNTSGPYTGKIVPGVPVQLRGTFGGVTSKVFTGVADVWGTQWPGENSSRVALSCVDQFSYFSYATVPSYSQLVVGDGPAVYYRLGDAAGTTSPADSSGFNRSATVSGPVTFGNTAGALIPADTGTCVSGWGTGANLTISSGMMAAPSALSVDCWFKGTGSAVAIGLVDPNALTNFWGLQVISGVWTAWAGASPTVTNGVAVDGNWHHIAATIDPAGSLIRLYIDGVIVASGATVIGVPPAGAFVINGSGTSTAFVQEAAIYTRSITAGSIQRHHNAGPWAQEDSGDRIARVLGISNFPPSATNLDRGTPQMQSQTSSLATTTLLSYMQLVEQSEYGALFMTVDGQVRLMDRATVLASNQNVGSVVTFGDGGGAEIPFELNPQVALDTLDTYTAALMQRVGGVAQNAGSGIRVFQASGLLNTSDSEILNYANWLVANLAVSVSRIRNITVHPFVDPTGAATTALLGLELMKIVTVNRHHVPGGGTAFTQTAFVEGINHHIDPTTGDWTVDLQLAPVQLPVWILGTSQLGVSTRLAF